jgi:hypothetical protein
MRKILTLQNNHLELEIDGLKILYPLSEIIIYHEGGGTRGDIFVQYAKHGQNQTNFGSCPPGCEICDGGK